MKGPPGQLAVADPDQAPPLGAEERLDDDVAPERVECRQRLGRRLPGPGRRDRESRRLEQGQRQILVDGRFDGPRRIEHGNARRRDAVQGVHPEDDLLQAARRHHPHQHAVGVPSGRSPPARDASHARPVDRRPRPTTSANGTACSDHAEPARRALEVGDMPAEAGNQGDQRSS